ncbi:E3 ubiquitin-protein ligase XERICO [Tripterygium wilfordii]|uniref:E3 ubiquitin-protein ligase XERICO n=1 Tax=Tripterygium wilfordii TaxID=458696 RepID=A0A7J7DM71_TRIWF|nr:E3 ubiquitin-protein ligase RHA2B-like [Tripterygium wilfordii]KAF5747427.1 E3 ubiquitin-protein ligase XERICO [Tripterygium wilfordii]
MAMAALPDFFSRFYTVTFVFFTISLLEIKNLFRSITRIASFQNTSKQLLTTTQFFKFLEERNPTISYTRKLKPQSRDCAVCLSDFVEGEKIRRLKCKHAFHKNCLDRWLNQYWATCPLCRSKVLPDEVVAGFHQSRQDPVEHDRSAEEIIYLLSALNGDSYHHGYF